MPLENIDLESPDLAAEPVSDELRRAIMHSIEIHGLHEMSQHVAIGIGLGYSLATVANEIRDCVEELI